MASLDLNDKVILVTGAGNGIGKRCIEEFGAQGARILATDIDGDALEEAVSGVAAAGGTAIAAQHDVTSAEDWARVIELCQSEFGRLNALVNNAGIMLHIPFVMCSYDDFRRQQTINVDSVFLGPSDHHPGCR